MDKPVSLIVYEWMMRGVGLALPYYLNKRANNGKEEHKRLQERYGQGYAPFLKLIDAYGFMLSQLAK